MTKQSQSYSTNGNNNYKADQQKFFSLGELFNNPKSNEWGQFVTMEAYPTNKQICDAKNFLRDTIEATELRLGKKAKNISWTVKYICKNDQGVDQAVVGWRAEMVNA